jgi:hypothetical protein
MTLFCKYKHIFGKPNEGVHQYRLFNLAIVDVLCTIVLIVILTLWTHLPWIHITMYTLIAMILCHRLFCVRTTTDKLFFPE